MPNVAVLGASNNPDRYSYKAVKMLQEYGHKVFPVHPSVKSVEGIECVASLADICEPIDTITLYLSEKNSTPIIEDIVRANPRRIILNPGTESDELRRRCEDSGIIVQEACTLVLLRTGQF